MADLHLAVGVNKPMDVFGDEWAGYMERIRENWLRVVTPADTVLLPGDLCWAMTLDEARPDFEYLAALPGRKILSKGNHDYWWQTVTKIRAWMDAGGFDMELLHNSAFLADGRIVCGTRGWKVPGEQPEADALEPAGESGFTEQDLKIYRRELERLKLSLEAGRKLASSAGIAAPEFVVMLHYPPFDGRRRPSGFVEIMRQYGVSDCVYGHLHGRSRYGATQGEVDGIRYRLVSSDQLRFEPFRISGGTMENG